MFTITANNGNEAWRKTFVTLYNFGEDTDNDKYFRDEVVLIEIANPTVELVDPLFPMSQENLEIINKYIYSGSDEDKVIHEWTKIYHHRIFDEPNSQIEYVIKKLLGDEIRGEVQVSIWDKNVDQDAEISPCTQILWFRKKFNKLEMHTHAHFSDAYKKLLMNIQEFISLQYYIAKRLGIEVGKYYHFLDSCHLHYKHKEEIENLISKLH